MVSPQGTQAAGDKSLRAAHRKRGESGEHSRGFEVRPPSEAYPGNVRE